MRSGELELALRTLGEVLEARGHEFELSKHTADLRKLEPTRDELVDAAKWARSHDPSDGFRQLLRSALTALGVEDGGDV